MASILTIAEIASLIGDPARANMLFALVDSDCASAGDLTRAGNVAPSTASEHLSKLADAGLVTVTRAGRHRHYRLTSERVRDVLEGLTALAAETRPGGPAELRRDAALLHARNCCDHLAGWLGVRIAEALLAKGWIAQSGGGLAITETGAPALADLGADPARFDIGPRRCVTFCHDWSESAFHLGGSLGAALLQAFCARDWMRRNRGEEVVRITPKGTRALRDRLGISLRA